MREELDEPAQTVLVHYLNLVQLAKLWSPVGARFVLAGIRDPVSETVSANPSSTTSAIPSASASASQTIHYQLKLVVYGLLESKDT